MATTKIWAVKDSLLRVVNYAINPEKTNLNNLKQVLLYAENNERTVDENEKTMFVTGVNCNRETAFEEMKMTQEKFGKCTGNIAYHAYQSFKTGEVSPELAHKIGVQIARKMWREYQVLVATHLDTGTYHNHFVVCSVNMFTGKKFNCNKGAYYRFRGLSDELCNENNLTVIKNPKGKTSAEIVADETGNSKTNIYRYIRLTELIKPLLQLVDDNKMAMNPAVEISYLREQEQKDLLETIESEDCTPSYPQAIRMKELSKQNKLDMDTIFNIMTEQKANQKEQIKFKVENLERYFPKGYSTKQMKDVIENLLKQYKRKWENKDF